MPNKRDDSVGRWWDKSWTLVRGCTWPDGEMPPACERCWARGMAKRFRPDYLDGVTTLPDNLSIPLKTRKPTVWACQIQYGDLFHPEVPDAFIGEAIAASRATADKGHTVVFLTKRPERVPRFIQCAETGRGLLVLASVWDQASTDRACAAFAKLPPGMKWGLHMEPLLGPVDLAAERRQGSKPSWIVVGGESGPGSRPLHPDWVRTIRDQCEVSGVPFYFKGWRDWMPRDQWTGGKPEREPQRMNLGHGGEVYRVGKKHSGRLLDGREHNEVPW